VSSNFSAPDRVNDAVFNHILWIMLKGQRFVSSLARQIAISRA
jgi:hypothetical protein